MEQDNPKESVPLYSFTWSSNYNDAGSGGVTIFSDPLPGAASAGDGTGGVTIINPDVSFGDLPPSVINSWVASGVDLSSHPLKATDDAAAMEMNGSAVIPVLSNDLGTARK